MSRRPGDSNNEGWGGLLAVAAGIGVGAVLLSTLFGNDNTNEELPLQYNDTDTIIADTPEKCRKAAVIIKRHCSNFEYLGLKCLWTNNSENRRDTVALLQLATDQGFCVIIRLSKLGNNISELEDILNDPNILKVGDNIVDNAIKLIQDHEISICGTLDLGLLAHQINYEESLVKLAKTLCNINIKKTKDLSQANWANPMLSSDEKEYAKKQAIAAIEVFKQLRIACGYNYNAIEHKIAKRYPIKIISVDMF